MGLERYLRTEELVEAEQPEINEIVNQTDDPALARSVCQHYEALLGAVDEVGARKAFLLLERHELFMSNGDDEPRKAFIQVLGSLLRSVYFRHRTLEGEYSPLSD